MRLIQVLAYAAIGGAIGLFLHYRVFTGVFDTSVANTPEDFAANSWDDNIRIGLSVVVWFLVLLMVPILAWAHMRGKKAPDATFGVLCLLVVMGILMVMFR